MTQLIQSIGATRDTVTTMGDDQNIGLIPITITTPVVGGVGIVRVAYGEFRCLLGKEFRYMVAGSIDLNSAHVPTPITAYVYVKLEAGVMSVNTSTTDPAELSLTNYFTVKTIRYYSPSGVAYILSTLPVAEQGIVKHLHTVKEDALYGRPIWIKGLGLNMAAGGVISVEVGKFKLPGSNMISVPVLTNAQIVLDNETTNVAGLNDITTYTDGSTITAGKYHTVLIGLKVDTTVASPLIVMRQAKPGTEYASLADAKEDAELCKSSSFGSDYQSGVLPIAWFTMLKGDYTDSYLYNLRGTILGQISGAGGVTDHGLLTGLADDDHIQYFNATRHDTTTAHGTGVVDHGSIAGLSDDDHTQYLRADGTRALSAGWDVGAFTVTAKSFTSDVAIGTAPFISTSTTTCTNLNADTVDGVEGANIVTADGLTPLTANWDAGSFEVRAETFESDVATGTAPFTVASATVVTNLNADTVDGLEGASFLQADGSVQLTGNLTVKAATTIDGIDISAHAADTEAHHATVTLSVDAGTILGLSTQEITLDSQTATYALMGPTSGGALAPTFRKILDADIAPATATMNLVDGSNDNVLGTDYARVYLISGPTAAFTIGGITGGLDGRVIYIVNRTGQNMTIEYEEGSSTDANRILTHSNADIVSTGNNSVILVYIAGTTNRWVVVSWNT